MHYFLKWNIKPDHIMENYHIIVQGAEAQVRTKNEIFVIEFDDPDKQAIFEKFAEKFTGKKRLNLFNTLFLRNLETKYSKEKVMTVLEELRDFSILPQPLYRYLDHGTCDVDGNADSGQDYADFSLSNVRLLLVGSAEFNRVIKRQAEKLNFKQITVKTFDSTWNRSHVGTAIQDADFMIVEASSWNPQQLQWLNKEALHKNLPWLYIEGLSINKLKIGPLFQGRETGCYNCLVKRQKSNRDTDLLRYDEQYENYLDEKNTFSKPDQTMYHPDTLNEILASMALLEITKYFKYWSTPALWGHYIALDISTFTVERHKLLKVPNCPVCKPKLEYNSSPWLEAISLSHD
jgi:bacteriocin biosynthesis cyclodehydratase domain-containing protein